MALSSSQSKLRDATADNHAAVDLEFSRYDLADIASYGEFLCAHARALGGVEQRLTAERSTLPAWSPRMPCLKADLEALGLPLPDSSPFKGDFSSAMVHGVLYVVEGSRLGSAVLSRRVGRMFPSTFLSAVHLQGEWTSFLAAFDGVAANKPARWFEDAIVGAKLTFDRYARSSSPQTFGSLSSS
jgi:heme oxygenase